MLRVRFHQPTEDYRPVEWPLNHPYWCSGQRSDDAWTLIAYVDDIEDITRLWPEAIDIEEPEEHSEYFLSSRFPMPEWFEPAPPDAERGEEN